MRDPDADNWTPVPDCGDPAEQFTLDNLDLLGEVTHSIRGTILRRLKAPLTVAELAELLNVPTTRLYHHVNLLTDLGLIRVVATRQVAAVTERRYQVVARSFQIDNELLNSTDKYELSAALCSLFDVAKLGFRRFVESGGLNDIDEDSEQSVLSIGEVRLSPRRQHELIQKVNSLVSEFSSDVDDDDPEGSRITLFVAAYEEVI